MTKLGVKTLCVGSGHGQKTTSNLNKGEHKLHFGLIGSSMGWRNSAGQRLMGNLTGVFNRPQAQHVTIYDAAVRTNMILMCSSRRVLSRSKKATVPLYSELVRQHLEHCVQGWAPHFQRDIDKRVCPGW